MAFAVAALFLLSALTTLAIEVIADPARNLGIPGQGLLRDLWVAEPARWIVPWLASFSIFVLLYKFAPDCKTYWKYVWTGAVVATVLFELGKWLFVWYLENVARYSQVYGSVASVIVLLTWTYLPAIILVLGAEVSSEYSRVRLRRQGHSVSGIYSALGHGKAAETASTDSMATKAQVPRRQRNRRHRNRPITNRTLTRACLQVPEVPHLADHVHLVD